MSDDRIPLRFAVVGAAPPWATAQEAVLIEEPAAVAFTLAPGVAVMRFGAVGAVHPTGCACCTGRGAAAAALGVLFQARARGEVAWFTAVVAVVADAAAVTAEVQGDRVAAARFRVVA